MNSMLILADIVWPALDLGTGAWTWWVILIGFLVEYPIVMWGFNMSYRKAFIANLAMNAASAFLGVIVLVIVGDLWEIFPGVILYKWLGMGTFDPITWGATLIFAVLINSGIESFVVRFVFKTGITRSRFFYLFLANALSVGLAFYEIYINPPRS